MISKQIGFNQRIKKEWIEYAINLLLAGNSEDVIRKELIKYLSDKLSVVKNSDRGNRQKTISIISRMWLRPIPELKEFRDEALELYRKSDQTHRDAIIWAVAMITYPFFAIVAGQIGKLLGLQEKISTTQVLKRVYDSYAETESISRAARRVLTSILDWQFLKETEKKGIYVKNSEIKISDENIVIFMADAFLFSMSVTQISMRDLLKNNVFFPFKLSSFDKNKYDQSHKEYKINVLNHGEVYFVKEK